MFNTRQRSHSNKVFLTVGVNISNKINDLLMVSLSCPAFEQG